METGHGAPEMAETASSTRRAMSFALNSTVGAAHPQTRNTYTNAPAVDHHLTELRAAVSSRRSKAYTPFIADAWEKHLRRAHLVNKYPSIINSIRFGFDIGVPLISRTQIPRNSDTLLNHSSEFQRIVDNEFRLHRYLGPFTRRQLEDTIGPFQTSPISLVPKPHKPNVYRLVQNYSYPHPSNNLYPSINSLINSDDFPCTWGTFNTMAQLILHLPPGSQGAVRDVAEAYRNIPVKPEQWPGMVVRLSNESDSFALDTQGFFGGSGCSGTFGGIADACTDIIRSQGIGPVINWADDHNFFRILRQYIEEYNEKRRQWKVSITGNGGRHQSGGRIWYGGRIRSDGSREEFGEDMVCQVQDLSRNSARSIDDGRYSCSLEDIDSISDELGIPWQKEKDQLWSSQITFTGLVWDIELKTVTITEHKRVKYLSAIENWQQNRQHDLKEVQKLYGKLLHASLVIRHGRAYLTHLESMLGIFHQKPFMRRTPPRGCEPDIEWWRLTLSSPPTPRALINPDSFISLAAYSDASSGLGLGICINNRWFAWRLTGNWKTNGRDIAWAEAVGFEMLVRHIIFASRLKQNVTVFGDNQGVVQGWRNGRSRSKEVNNVFKRIQSVLDNAGFEVQTEYIPSKSNPADGPSRGKFPPISLLLPHIKIPNPLQEWIKPFDFDNLSATNPQVQSRHERTQTKLHHTALPHAQEQRDLTELRYLSKQF